MPRYFKDKNERPDFPRGDNHPAYGVLGDEEIDRGFGPEHPSGYTTFYHRPSREDPNILKGGHGWGNVPHRGFHPDATELFRHTPETLTVNSMFADHRVRPHMMTVMALAMQDHPNAQLVAGETLTADSSALSRHAHKLGLVVPHPDNPEMEKSEGNEYTAQPAKFTQLTSPREMKQRFLGETTTEVPHSEVMAGKQFLKQMLRPGTTRKQTPRVESEQMQLPGMESK